MNEIEHLPAAQLDTQHIFRHDENTELLIVLEVLEVADGVRVYAVGDAETGDFQRLYAPDDGDNVQLVSENGL